MTSLFRSEVMSRCQLILQSESAYNCISELGELGLIQFIDLNPEMSPFQRKFVSEVKRCEELERKLRFVEKECIKDGLPIYEPRDDFPAPPQREMSELEVRLGNIEKDLLDISANCVTLRKNQLELLELKFLLAKAHFLSGPSFPVAEEDEDIHRLDEGLQGMKFNMVAGVIRRIRIPAFERMVWRICKGNVFIKTSDIEEDLRDPESGDPLLKTVFMIFFQGEQLKTRIKKVCDGFQAAQYLCPQKMDERREMAYGVNTRLEDLSTVLKQSEEHRTRMLTEGTKELRAWYTKIRKIKAIYYCLNSFNFDVTRKAMIAECWIPEADSADILDALRRGADLSGSTVPPIFNTIGYSGDPPTFNRLNKYTSAFQSLIDAYGVNSYREVNPAPFAIITFPFLFGVMFGDFGHGLLMLTAAIALIANEKKWARIDQEIFAMLFGGRYIILLMSLFSIYTGLIYNDCFSKSFNVFGSAWKFSGNATQIGDKGGLMLDPANPDQNTGETYAFGIDPVWQLATNKITFLNTYKMKISLIFGLTHMVFGVLVSLWNKINYKKYSDILLEFVPQLVFLVFIFVYLLFLIFFKWVRYSAGKTDWSEHCAPNLLITFINMMLFKRDSVDPKLQALCHGHQSYMYTGQESIQKVLVIVGVLMIPIMLLGKPVYIALGRRRRRSNYSPIEDDDDAGASEEGMGDIVIFQAIHTIEYVLGAVSHTASYLRLWALSLAHSQLSEVLWLMVLRKGFGRDLTDSIFLFVIFSSWAVLTVAILVVMEGLSAFLHTLRLHWVEFMSKFYEGKGSLFVPFSFKTFLSDSRMADREALSG